MNLAVIQGMSRLRLKPNQPETFYHLMTRTSQQALYMTDIPGFKDIADRIIREAAAVYYVEIYASAIMGNHYHLVIRMSMPQCDAGDVRARYERHQTRLKEKRGWQDWFLKPWYRRLTDLSKFMKDVNQRIAVAYNRIQDTTGHFWGARYKSLIIEDQESLLKVMAYVEQNPVKAGLSEKPSEYANCTAGKIKRDLEQGLAPDIPRIGIFKDMQGMECAKAYVLWMDYLSDRMFHPENQSEPPPWQINRLFLSKQVLAVWQQEFKNGAPSNWSRSSVGSDKFEQQMTAGLKARRRELDRAHFQKRRRQKPD